MGEYLDLHVFMFKMNIFIGGLFNVSIVLRKIFFFPKFLDTNEGTLLIYI